MDNRDIDIASIYHEETKHTYDRVYRSHHFLDWDNQPRPYKEYRTLEPLPLPQELPETGMPALLALSQSVGTLISTALPTLDELAYVLYYAAGVTRRRIYPGHGEVCFRSAACTGALYHIDLYVAVADLPGLAAGLYHFDPIGFALRQLRLGDYRRVLAQASGNEPVLQKAPVIIVGADTFWRNTWKYRARAYRHSFWDSGTILANLLAAATALGRTARLITGFTDIHVNALLGLDTAREVTLFLVGLGHGAPLSDVRPVEPLQLEVVPLSREESAYPAIGILHTASTLQRPDDVVSWRMTTPPVPLPVTTQTVFPLRPDAPEELPQAGLENAVRRRGSSRQFAHRELSFAHLSNVLVYATQHILADFLSAPDCRLNDLYLIVHAVADLPPGTYVYRPQEEALERLAEGDFRHEAGMLALGQELAADASVNIYFLCDLELVLEQYGNRGYRVAQLEAGLLGGRMYLAAYAQRFGASGLTFFDDEVIDFFSPHAAGKSVMFLLAMGHAAPRR